MIKVTDLMTDEFKTTLAFVSIVVGWAVAIVLFIPTLGHSYSLFDKLGRFYESRVKGWEWD